MNSTNIRPDSRTPKSLRECFHNVTGHFWREINNLKESSSLLAYHVKRSRDNGWKNVSIPYPAALAVIQQIDDSSMVLADIFEATKQTAILADKNRAIAETLYIHPIEKTFEQFIRGNIQEDELQKQINKVFSVKKDLAA
jgi:hypothetical protein